MGLASLHNKSSDYKEVRMIFGSILGHMSVVKKGNRRRDTNKASHSKGVGDGGDDTVAWSPKLLQECLIGMKSMDDTNNVTLKGIQKLSLLVNSSHYSLWTFELATQSLLGLKSMTASSKEVQLLLQALTKKLLRLHSTTGSASLSLESISPALLGLEAMNSQSYEVRQLLDTLASYMKRTSACINVRSESQHAAQVGRCLVGMRHMSMHHSEVFTMGELLANKINGNTPTLRLSPLTLSLTLTLTLHSCDGVCTL